MARPRVMVSYSWKVQDTVLRLVEKLKTEFEVWIDMEQMTGDVLGTMSMVCKKRFKNIDGVVMMSGVVVSFSFLLILISFFSSFFLSFFFFRQ